MADLEKFSMEHDMPIVSIADLIQYRMQTERLVRRVVERPLKLDQTGSEWLFIAYEILGEPRQFLALVKGTIDAGAPTLCRVHSGTLIGDLFASTPFDGGTNLRESIRIIEELGTGLVLFIPPLRADLSSEISSVVDKINRRRESPSHSEQDSTLREFGLGAQVLADLQISELRLLTNNHAKIAGLAGFGLRVVERIPLHSRHFPRESSQGLTEPPAGDKALDSPEGGRQASQDGQ